MLSFKLQKSELSARRGEYRFVIERVDDEDGPCCWHRLTIEKDGAHHYCYKSIKLTDAIQCFEIAELMNNKYKKQERAARAARKEKK